MQTKTRVVTETWRIVMDVQTNGATEEETALLVLHMEQIVKRFGHVCKGFKVVAGSVSDIERTGESKW
jgi:hypothetical protein